MNPPLVSVLSQMNPVHKFPPYFPKIHSNIIILSTPRSSEWPLLFTFPTKMLRISHFSIFSTCSTHLNLFDLISLTVFGEADNVIKPLIMQSSPASCHFLPLRSFPQQPVLKHSQSVLFEEDGMSGNVTHIGEIRKVYKILVVKPKPFQVPGVDKMIILKLILKK